VVADLISALLVGLFVFAFVLRGKQKRADRKAAAAELAQRGAVTVPGASERDDT
jgi:hypothetical protein